MVSADSIHQNTYCKYIYLAPGCVLPYNVASMFCCLVGNWPGMDSDGM